MLRISSVESVESEVTLRVEGQVKGRWVGVLRESCQAVLAQGRPLSLDLGGVLFIDDEGVAFLRSLAARQVALTNCSPFTAQQLRS